MDTEPNFPGFTAPTPTVYLRNPDVDLPTFLAKLTTSVREGMGGRNRELVMGALDVAGVRWKCPTCGADDQPLVESECEGCNKDRTVLALIVEYLTWFEANPPLSPKGIPLRYRPTYKDCPCAAYWSGDSLRINFYQLAKLVLGEYCAPGDLQRKGADLKREASKARMIFGAKVVISGATYNILGVGACEEIQRRVDAAAVETPEQRTHRASVTLNGWEDMHPDDLEISLQGTQANWRDYRLVAS